MKLSRYDFERPLIDFAGVQQVNPQRHAMALLSGVLEIDASCRSAVGWYDALDLATWGFAPCTGSQPLSPIQLCESAAQLAGFYTRFSRLFEDRLAGLGGFDAVEFLADVNPGERIIHQTHLTVVRSGRRAVFESQAYVQSQLVFRGTILIVPLSSRHE